MIAHMHHALLCAFYVFSKSKILDTQKQLIHYLYANFVFFFEECKKNSRD